MRPSAAALSYWCFGMLLSAPRTKSPISAVPQSVNTKTALNSPLRLSPKTRALPKKTRKRSTNCGMMRIKSR